MPRAYGERRSAPARSEGSRLPHTGNHDAGNTVPHVLEPGHTFMGLGTQTEEIVTELILARLEMPDARVLFERQDAGTEVLRSDIAERRARLEGFCDAAAAGKISQRSFARIEDQLLAEIADLEKKARRVDVPAVVGQMADQPRKVWAKLSITQRRDVIRSLVEIRVLKMRKGARPVPPESIAVEWIGQS